MGYLRFGCVTWYTLFNSHMNCEKFLAYVYVYCVNKQLLIFPDNFLFDVIPNCYYMMKHRIVHYRSESVIVSLLECISMLCSAFACITFSLAISTIYFSDYYNIMITLCLIYKIAYVHAGHCFKRLDYVLFSNYEILLFNLRNEQCR